MRCTLPIALAVIVNLIALPCASIGQEPNPGEKTEPFSDEAKSVLTESVGLFAGLQLYNAYLNIGILADARAEGLYEPADVNQLLGSVVLPLDRVDKQLDKIAKLKLTKEDAEAVARLKRIAALLRQQGKELQTYWDKNLPENGKKYEASRQAAWKELNALLELEPKTEKQNTLRSTTPARP